MHMSIAIITAFASKNWSLDKGRAAQIRDVLNVYLGFPERNHNPFGKDLVFDENANKITLWMSMHIIKSFANDPWEDDPPLTQDMREIFNNIMNTLVPDRDEYDEFDLVMGEADNEKILDDFKRNLEEKHGFKILETLHYIHQIQPPKLMF